jgi:hypothetical protein
MKDGGLGGVLKKYLPFVDFQSVETWSTGQGVPDLNFCFDRYEGWLELKMTSTNKVKIRAEQIAWIERRCRAGGRVFLVVRYKHKASARKQIRDELYLFRGKDIRAVFLGGIEGAQPLYISNGGPARWDWEAFSSALKASP